MDEQRTSGAAGVVEIGHQQPVHAVVAHVGERHGTAGSDIRVYPYLIWGGSGGTSGSARTSGSPPPCKTALFRIPFSMSRESGRALWSS